ncbi:hypothetical protein ACJJTC_015280 [Scirpophaga incertulas]
MDIINNTQLVNILSAWNFKRKHHYIDDLFLMDSPVPLFVITGTYLLFVLKLGPDFMKEKSPMKLNKLIIFYNAAQVLFSTYLFNIGFQLLATNGLLNSACNLTKISPIMTTGFYLYLIAKITELLDTVFFVLRKKQNQVTFLHVYHHTAMLWNTWLSVKYDSTYTLVFLGTVNSLIHVLMYAYYGLSSFPSMAKYLWWKKYLTSMQLIQFLLVMVHAVANHYYGCKITKLALSLILLNSSIFLVLFSNFYVKSYTKVSRNIKDKNY